MSIQRITNIHIIHTSSESKEVHRDNVGKIPPAVHLPNHTDGNHIPNPSVAVLRFDDMVRLNKTHENALDLAEAVPHSWCISASI